MSIDAFTLSALAVVLFVIVVLGWALTRSRSIDRDTITQLQQQLEGVSSGALVPSTAARELCRAIRCLYPSAQSGVDFSVADAGDGTYIREWELPVAQPDTARLQQAMVECRKASETSRYREERALAYPSIGDQLDAMYKARNGDGAALDAIDQQIAEVKARFPNPDASC